MNYAQAKRIADALEALVEEVRLLREAITLPIAPTAPNDTTTEVVYFPSEKSSAKSGFRSLSGRG